MKTRFVLPAASAAVLTLASAAQAGSVANFAFETYGMTSGGTQVSLGSGDYGVIDLYADFSGGSPTARLLSLIDMNISLTSGSFVHNDAAATNHWSATYSAAALGGTAAIDSFVTMGAAVSGDPFVATLDPNFDGSIGGSVSTDAGWYNGDPTNGQGVVDGSMRVFIGRFVIANADVDGNTFSVSGVMSYRPDSTSGAPSFASSSDSVTLASIPVVPGPMGLATLAAATLIRRRRR